jgi:TatD DNase family protein
MLEFAQELPSVLQRASDAAVSAIVCPGVDLPSSREAVDLARLHPCVRAAVGIHPNDCADLPPDWVDRLRVLAAEPEVVAIGEVGLDNYRQHTKSDLQRAVLEAQLDLAAELDLPVVIHNREADLELAEILHKWVAALPARHPRGVLHCFSGDRVFMERFCAMGFYISFAGPITYRNAGKIVETAAATPRDRLLVETDSPYLAPHPHRGKRNEPAYVRLVAERLADIRQEGLDGVIEATGQNAARLFRLELQPASHER